MTGHMHGAPSAAREGAAPEVGEWHRLHWATPILRGGIVFVALIAFVISNGLNGFLQRLSSDRLEEIESKHTETPTPTPTPTSTPTDGDSGFWQSIPWDDLSGWITSAAWGLGILSAIVLGWAAWRSHRFRIGEDAIEVQKGILSRSERQIRFDRIQGINISKTVLGALFGLAKLEFDAAGEDANIELAFLKLKDAEAIRQDVLARASGAKRARDAKLPNTAANAGQHGSTAHPEVTGDTGASVPDVEHEAEQGAVPEPATHSSLERFLRDRIDELAGDDLAGEDPASRSVVEVSLPRIILSRVLNFAIWMLIVLVCMGAACLTAVFAFAADELADDGILEEVLLSVVVISLPSLLPFIGVVFGQIQQLARFTIVGTPDGLRIGRGLFATTSDTLPPGRIHAIHVQQPLIWRPFGWWQMSIIRASRTKSDGSNGKQNAVANNVILPVGTREDVHRILSIALPLHETPHFHAALEAAMLGRNRDRRDGFLPADHTTKWLHPFLARRVASQLEAGVLLMRKGAWNRSATIVPAERIQSVSVSRSLIDRMRGTVSLRADAVPGNFGTVVRFVQSERADLMQDRLLDVAMEAAERDNSHRWADAAARSTIASARIQAEQARTMGAALDARTSAVLVAADEWDREHPVESAPATLEDRAGSDDWSDAPDAADTPGTPDAAERGQAK